MGHCNFFLQKIWKYVHFLGYLNPSYNYVYLSCSTAANPAAAYQANPTGYAVGPSAAAGTYTAQRAQATYDSGYSAATSHASASYPTTPSTTYEYGYTAQRPSQPAAAAAAAAAAAVYDASKSYYSQNNAAAAVAATAATSYASSETSYPGLNWRNFNLYRFNHQVDLWIFCLNDCN